MKTVKNELVHWLILAMPVIYLIAVYNQLPNIIPTHFTSNGVPNDYSRKIFLLGFVPGFLLFMYLLILFIPKINPGNRLSNNPKTISILRLLLNCLNSALCLVIIYVSGSNANLQLGTIVIMITAILTVVALLVYLYFIAKLHSSMGSELLQDDNYYYKWGFFYYNPNNPKIWVPKRYGLGWTLNMANPVSYLIFAVIIGFIIFILFISK